MARNQLGSAFGFSLSKRQRAVLSSVRSPAHSTTITRRQHSPILSRTSSRSCHVVQRGAGDLLQRVVLLELAL
jgi:hypothetical protein